MRLPLLRVEMARPLLGTTVSIGAWSDSESCAHRAMRPLPKSRSSIGYYLGNDRLIAATALLHWSVGLAAPLAFLLHRFAETARKKRRHATLPG
jgi:hypothetical protein